MDDLFTCQACGDTFTKGRPDDEAMAEAIQRHGADALESPALVCEDCFARCFDRLKLYWVSFVAFPPPPDGDGFRGVAMVYAASEEQAVRRAHELGAFTEMVQAWADVIERGRPSIPPQLIGVLMPREWCDALSDYMCAIYGRADQTLGIA